MRCQLAKLQAVLSRTHFQEQCGIALVNFNCSQSATVNFLFVVRHDMYEAFWIIQLVSPSPDPHKWMWLYASSLEDYLDIVLIYKLLITLVRLKTFKSEINLSRAQASLT